MPQDFELRLKAVDAMLLTPFVRQAILQPTAEVLNWTSAPLGGGAAQPEEGVIGRIRFTGTAQVYQRHVPWSIVLKAFAPPLNSETPDQTIWTYWKREVLAYQSGMLHDLAGGLEAPRCFAVVEYPGEEYWVWMEYVQEAYKTWSLQQYELAALHLGQFNGAHLSSRPLPADPWLNVGHFRQWFALAEPGLQHIHRLAQHPQSWVTQETAEQTLCLYAEHARLLDCLEQLPQCLCHHDAFRRNLMIRQNSAGQEQTVAIDWSAVGPGAVGEEIATLVAFSLYFLEARAADALRLDEVVFTAYIAGLRNAGWQGDERMVRLGYAAAAGLWGAISATGFLLPHIEEDRWITAVSQPGVVSPRIEDKELRATWDEEAGAKRMLAQWRQAHRWSLDLGNEALSLL